MILRLWNYYTLYIVTSFCFATLALMLAVHPLPFWKDALVNSRPFRGEMGFGRFIIRGSRRINGGTTITAFAYAWRRTDPTRWSRASAWFGYLIHQLGQWYIITQVTLQRMAGTNHSYSYTFRWWNWYMIYLNVTMAGYKLIQSHLFYDGLAGDISEAFTQGSVIMVLVIALILAIPRRGIIFGYPREDIRSVSYNIVWDFIKKHHSYIVSFGTVFNFHYHPVEGTLAHHGGFLYQCLLLWQSSNFLHLSHRNRCWVLFLEIWVLVHGSITAYYQPGTGWQIFFYGFLLVFLVNQIYDTGLLDRQHFCLWRTSLVYFLFILLVMAGFGMNDHRYYRLLFIPVAEYLSVFYCLGLGMVTRYCLHHHARSCMGWLPRWLIISTMYMLSGLGVMVGMAYILSGHLSVYDDY